MAQQTLHALSLLVCKEPDAIKPYANSIIPLVVSTGGGVEMVEESAHSCRGLLSGHAAAACLNTTWGLRDDDVTPQL